MMSFPFRSFVGSGGGVFEHHGGAFLADHDAGCVGVAGDDLRHDGGVGDAQAGNPMDAQPRIDYRVRTGAHAAGADGVQVGDAAGADVGDHFGVGGTGGAGQGFLDDVGF